MIRKTLLLLIIWVFLGACNNNTVVTTAIPEMDTPVVPGTEPAGLPNPASVYCEEQGYTVVMREGEGGVYGVCLFPDGSECDEWAYYRGECRPGDSLPTPTATTPSETMIEDGWQTYHNEVPAYSFRYPAEAVIEPGNDPQKNVTVRGPLVADEYWPMIYISHPSDQEMYQPPEDVNLAEWLVTHNLLPAQTGDQTGEIRLEDMDFAGETAIHTRFNRSPQSYAYDKFFIAHSGQLYVIVILHTGDQEDWALYQRFLESLQFKS